jgi:hypothetical protein
VIEDDHRKLRQAQELRRQDPAVAGNDIAMLVDQNRIDHPVLPHATGNLPNLLSGMGASIRRVGYQALNGPDFQAAYDDYVIHKLLWVRSVVFATVQPTVCGPENRSVSSRQYHRGG